MQQEDQNIKNFLNQVESLNMYVSMNEYMAKLFFNSFSQNNALLKNIFNNQDDKNKFLNMLEIQMKMPYFDVKKFIVENGLLVILLNDCENEENVLIINKIFNIVYFVLQKLKEEQENNIIIQIKYKLHSIFDKNIDNINRPENINLLNKMITFANMNSNELGDNDDDIKIEYAKENLSKVISLINNDEEEEEKKEENKKDNGENDGKIRDKINKNWEKIKMKKAKELEKKII